MDEITRQFSIGEAADMLGVSIPTIRMYEREGLFITSRRDSRHRRYTEADLERLRCIRNMIRREKVSIAGMRRLLALIPCWSIRNCPEDARQACNAYRQTDAPCWLASNRSWLCKSAECRSCEVYTHAADCHTLKDTIARYTSDVPVPGKTCEAA